MPRTRILRGLHAVASPPTRAVVSIGVFDGVHRAHQHIVRSTVRLAHRLQGTSVIVTFDPDPSVVLNPRHAPPALMPVEDRIHQLCRLGVDWIWVVPFTKQFSRLKPEQFVRRILLRRLRARALVVGADFAFGRDRRGNMTLLQALGAPTGMRVIPTGPIRRGGAVISSSRIRGLIARGRLRAAASLLGRPPVLYGMVVRGVGRGRRLGVPTANIRLIPQVLPPQGVYAVLVRSTADRRDRRGVMNLGVRPTFGGGPVTCEVHLVGFSGTVPRRPVAVSLLARLRSERCFPSPAALVRQVRRDVSRARQLFRRIV